MSYTIPLDDIGCAAGDPLNIAAHAIVYYAVSTDTFNVVSYSSAQVTRNRAGNGPTPFEDQVVDEAAVLAWEPCTGYQNCPIPNANPPYDYPDPSLWDNRITNKAALNAGADWIWAPSDVQAVLSSDLTTPTYSPEYAVQEPVNGEVVRFEKTFDFPGPPVDGQLYVNCDNGLEAFVNGTSVATENVSADWKNSDLYQASVDTNGWDTTVHQDVTSQLVDGSNTFMLDGTNEYMDPDDSNGAGGHNPHGTYVVNPGGCLSLLAVEYSNAVDTAWGAGSEFGGKSWATYITSTIAE